MTKEEAIKLLKVRIDLIKAHYPDIDDYREALGMAIKALEQEPEHLVNESGDLVKDLVKDTISRQTVLSKIKEVCFSEEWLQFRVDNGSNGQRDFLINYIKQLPPVNSQEPKTGHWIRELIRNEKGGCIGAKRICSECGNDNKHDEYMNYCPNCGAKMIEPQERSDKDADSN